MMASVKEDPFLEGVGDEVVCGISVGLAASLLLAWSIYYWTTRRPVQQEIHPDSQDNVRVVRDRIPPRRHSSRQTNADTVCPVCLSQPSHAIETNCGHVFCGICMVTYWQHGSWMGAVRCPVCRQTVTLILFLFNEEERRTESAERDTVISNINLYNRRFSGEPRDWLDHLRDLPMLLRHLGAEFFSQSGLILMFRLRVVVCFLFAIIYLISPLDLLPEAVFGLLGFLDDFFVLMLLTIYISIVYRGLIAMRAENFQ